MQKAIHYFILTTAIAFISACNNDDVKKDAIARVHDKYLSKAELARAIPFGLKGEDSVSFANEFITQWLKQNLVLRKAENNLNDEEKDVSRQLEDYRTSLIIFAYERELVKQKLDTLVSDDEISKYYQDHPNNFELKSNIIRLKYIKLPKKTPNSDKAKKWFRSEKEEEQNKIQQFAKLYAVNFLLDDSNWLLLEDVIKEIPLDENEIGNVNNQPKFIELFDEKYQYLVTVTGFMVKDSQAPLEFEKNTIRNIILNKRKILLIQKMQDDAYNDALNEKDIEVYGNN
jgi:hypothetical protein